MLLRPTKLAACLITLTAVLAPGCTHLSPVTESTDARGNPVYESTVHYTNGVPRTTTKETVLGSDDRCEIVRIERDFYDRTGMLMQRTVDRERCRVVEFRVEEHYDAAEATMLRVVSRDVDHDGYFDLEATRARALSERELASLTR